MEKTVSIVLILSGLFVLSGCAGNRGIDLQVTALRCEYLTEPRGIDETSPRLSWELTAPSRGQAQTAYRILVASTAEKLANGVGDLWDTGKVVSDQSIQVVYDGRPLTSRARCFWKVMAWDRKDIPMAWSDAAQWSMGLLESTDWEASWIKMAITDLDYVAGLGKNKDLPLAPPPYFRKPVTVAKPVRHAAVYITALGIYELHLNGSRVGRDYFIPGWTQYNKRLQYQTYEVTDLLTTGDNVLGAILAEGWFNGHLSWESNRWVYGTENSMFAQLVIEYEDGSTEIIGTDTSWRCAYGPIRYASLYMGELYDARKAITGWDASHFDDSGWTSAVLSPDPKITLAAQRTQPVRVTDTLKPVSISEPADGVFVYDLGRNIVGWVRLKVSGPAGTRVTIRHAERLNEDGTIYTENLRSAKATDSYIHDGGKEAVFEPQFTFHGFQYVEVTGLAETPDLSTLTGVVVHSDTPPAGTFTCSDSLVNRLYSNIVWGQRGNFLSVPTDCPQRDERLGWMGDAQTFIQTAAYNMDVSAFFTKWMYDVVDAQSPEGPFCFISPSIERDGYRGEAAPAWSDAGIIVPWTMYRMYGDTRIIEIHWNAMTRYMENLMAANPAFIRRNKLGGNWGDWLSISDDTPKYLLATAFWAYDARCMAEMAAAVGRTEEAETYGSLFRNIRTAFQERYLASDGRVFPQDGDLEKAGAYPPTHDYTGGIGESQTGYLLALQLDLVPGELRDAAAAHLVRKIRENDWHLSSGFVGIRFLNPVLCETGSSDIAYRLLLNRTYPSWLYPVLNGATTIWERWDGWTKEKGFQDPLMNSFNHYSLGSVGEWLFGYVTGIQPDPSAPGFKRFRIKPYPGPGLDWAKAFYHSMHGIIESGWRREGDTFTLDVTIPVNTTALVAVPADGDARITVPAGESDTITPLGREGRWETFRVGSGTYQFVSTLAVE